jgi:hypothetical protein
MMHILKNHTLTNKWRWEYSRAMILYKGKRGRFKSNKSGMDYHGTELGFGRGNLYINSLLPMTDRGGRPGTDYDSLCTSWPKRLTCDVRPYRPCPITGVVPASLSGQVEPKSPQARSLTAGSDRPVIPLRKINVLRETVEEFRWPRRGKNKVDADQRAGPRQAAVGRVSEPALFTVCTV